MAMKKKPNKKSTVKTKKPAPKKPGEKSTDADTMLAIAAGGSGAGATGPSVKKYIPGIDLSPPSDGVAAEKAREKVSKIKKPDEKSKPADKPADKKPGVPDMDGIRPWEARQLRRFLQALNHFLRDRAPIWVMTDQEIEAFVETIPPVADKWIPDAAAWLPEIALFMTIFAYSGLRLTAAKVALKQKPAPVPVSSKKTKSVIQDTVDDFDAMVQEAQDNARRLRR